MLIQAAGSGIGSAAVQVAKLAGAARIRATARAASRADDLEERRANLEVDRHGAAERLEIVVGRLGLEGEGSDAQHEAELARREKLKREG